MRVNDENVHDVDDYSVLNAVTTQNNHFFVVDVCVTRQAIRSGSKMILKKFKSWIEQLSSGYWRKSTRSTATDKHFTNFYFFRCFVVVTTDHTIYIRLKLNFPSSTMLFNLFEFLKTFRCEMNWVRVSDRSIYNNEEYNCLLLIVQVMIRWKQQFHLIKWYSFLAPQFLWFRGDMTDKNQQFLLWLLCKLIPGGN